MCIVNVTKVHVVWTMYFKHKSHSNYANFSNICGVQQMLFVIISTNSCTY